MRKLALVTLVSIGLLLTSVPAVATSPGANGEMLYLRFRGIYEQPRHRTIAPDGSADAPLSLPRGADARWSPDGSVIAAAVNGRQRQRLVLVDPATGDVTRVLSNAEMPAGVDFIWGLAFGPAGDELVFCAWQNVVGPVTRLYTVATDGSGLTMISGSRPLCSPDWSSTGRIVAGVEGDRTKLFTLDPDGSNAQKVLALPADRNPSVGVSESPSWAPDGSAIAFLSMSERRRTDVWLVDADGSDPRRLTDTRRRWEWSPIFSPDGASVAHSRSRRGFWDPNDLWIAALAGGRHRVTSTPRLDEHVMSWRAV